jgi:hypothetical protein
VKRYGVGKALLDELAESGDGNGGHRRGRRRPSNDGNDGHGLLRYAEQLEQTLYRTKPEHKKDR